MKIGNKVIVKEETALIPEFANREGTIISEHIPNSQAAMLAGISRWVVEFDEPVNVRGEVIATCKFREDELNLLK